MKKMSLRNQGLLVNAAILAALTFEYLRGNPVIAIVVSAILLLPLVNVIFFVRSQRAKKVQ